MKIQRRGGFASILMLAVVGIGLSAGLITLSRIQASSDPLLEHPKASHPTGSDRLNHVFRFQIALHRLLILIASKHRLRTHILIALNPRSVSYVPLWSS